MSREWVVELVKHLPQGIVSRGWGWLVRQRHPKIGAWALKRGFVAAMGIDMGESEAPIESFDCLEDLFVRRLKAGARRIDPDPHAVVSPVDGSIGMCGTVENGTLLQIKGRSYSLAQLLGDEVAAQSFEGGHYATLYLAPHNYHRVHAPIAGVVREAMLIPGALMPVFTESVQTIDELFARNERLVTYIDSERGGRLAVVKVGATLVGRISVAYDPSIHTNRPKQPQRHLNYDPPRALLQKRC
ncbi:MAG: archaetidylserine decarboxylase [Myxococcota bacterium]